MSPVAVEHHLRRLRLAATTAHVIPPLSLDLVGADGRIRRIGSTPQSRPDLPSDRFRSVVADMHNEGTLRALSDVLELPVGPFGLRVHLGCRHVRDLGGGLYVLHGRDRVRVVFVTLLDGHRTRTVTKAVERPRAADASCPALRSIAAVGPVEVMVDQQTEVTVVYCDQEHPAGLPALEAYGQALFSACVVAELLDGLG